MSLFNYRGFYTNLEDENPFVGEYYNLGESLHGKGFATKVNAYIYNLITEVANSVKFRIHFFRLSRRHFFSLLLVPVIKAH